MTGADLIRWIHDNEAENLDVNVYGCDGTLTEHCSVSIDDCYGIIIDEL